VNAVSFLLSTDVREKYIHVVVSPSRCFNQWNLLHFVRPIKILDFAHMWRYTGLMTVFFLPPFFVKTNRISYHKCYRLHFCASVKLFKLIGAGKNWVGPQLSLLVKIWSLRSIAVSIVHQWSGEKDEISAHPCCVSQTHLPPEVYKTVKILRF
jgi:hypothetical protein